MTKTFENGPASQSPPPTPLGVEVGAVSKQSHLVRNKAVYSAVCTTSTSTSGTAVLMSTTENHLAANSQQQPNSLAEEDSVTNLDELKLRALLDEAITYKTPKDREGKSKLFNTLLIDAEDDLRKEHAHNASGPARHFSSTAKKRHRQRRQPSSVSENLTHGGSLNDLAKQELYEYESAKAPRPKTVSTRQREGGSLPCNVNAGAPHVDKAYFMEERARQQEQRNMRSNAADFTQSVLGLDFPTAAAMLGGLEPSSTYISQTSIPISAKVDEGFTFSQLNLPSGGNSVNSVLNVDGTQRISITKKPPSTQQFSLLNPKKLDENDNTLMQNIAAANDGASITAVACAKRKPKQKKPTENVITADKIKGHRSDIIGNIDMLVSFIEGTEDKAKKKLHKQHSHTLANEDKSKSKRTRKKSASMLQKSNSMEDVSITKLEDFSFDALDVKEKTPLRPTKSNAERPSRLHKTWVVSSEQLQMPVSSTSAENVEIADFIYVTKKKKSKKRRNSLGSRGNPPQSASDTRPAEFHSLRVSSPRRKSASSAPHSEKSDSSDNESVHSLPLDGDNKAHQISYADIAKSSERPKWHRLPSERRKSDKSHPSGDEKPVDQPHVPVNQPTQNACMHASAVPAPVTTSATSTTITPNTHTQSTPALHFINQPECTKEPAKTLPKESETDTDLSSLQNWPEIRNNKVNQAKTNMTASAMTADVAVQPLQDWPTIISNGAKQAPAKHAAQAKTMDNKKKPSGGKLTQNQSQPHQHAQVNEHLQQVLQVQVASHPIQSNHPNDGGVYYNRHNNHDQQEEIVNNPQQVIQQVSEQSHLYQMPPNIRDVQSIEEMQMRSLQAAQMSPAFAEDEDYSSSQMSLSSPVQCNMSLSSEKYRPAVVILSSGGDRHSTSDITFGFGINEQLLSGDVCADFVSRFLQPEVAQINNDINQLVNYIGSEWEDVLMQTHTGKVKYYTDELS